MADLMANLALDLSGVHKTYRGKVHALRGIDMQVHRGEVFGLLGPNGAGKSTLVKILMSVIRPSRCSGTLLGRPVGHKPTLARVGYLPEHHRFPDYLTGRQVLDFYAALSHVRRADRRRRSAELLDLVGMTDWGTKKVRSYSKGMRQRLGVAQSLMNDPHLVVLDEPTDGVDPVGRRDIRDIVKRLRDEKRTVFINSHLLSELEMVCDRVAILVQGEVSAQGSLDHLTRDARRYEIELTDPLPAVAAGEFAPMLPADLLVGDAEPLTIEGRTIHVATHSPEAIQPLLSRLLARGAVIRSVRQFRPSLEDLFMQAVTDPETGRALAPGAKGDRK